MCELLKNLRRLLSETKTPLALYRHVSVPVAPDQGKGSDRHGFFKIESDSVFLGYCLTGAHHRFVSDSGTDSTCSRAR